MMKLDQKQQSDTRCNHNQALFILITLEKSLYRKIPSFFASKCYVPEYTLCCPSFTDGLEFSSNFENGNLKKAIRVKRDEYELIVEADYNTKGHFHWYFFRTTSTLPAGTLVHFKILNMIKPTSLHSAGFKPFGFSLKKHQEKSKMCSIILR